MTDSQSKLREEVNFWRKLIERWAPHVGSLERQKMYDALAYAQHELRYNRRNQYPLLLHSNATERRPVDRQDNRGCEADAEACPLSPHRPSRD